MTNNILLCYYLVYLIRDLSGVLGKRNYDGVANMFSGTEDNFVYCLVPPKSSELLPLSELRVEYVALLTLSLLFP